MDLRKLSEEIFSEEENLAELEALIKNLQLENAEDEEELKEREIIALSKVV